MHTLRRRKPFGREELQLGGEHAQYRACGRRFGSRHYHSDVRVAAGFNAGVALKRAGRASCSAAHEGGRQLRQAHRRRDRDNEQGALIR